MNKKKFAEKCNDLVQYEITTIEKLKAFVAPMNTKLKELGYEIYVGQYWANHTVSDELFYERISITAGYMASAVVVFQLLGADPLEDPIPGKEIGFHLAEEIAAYGETFFSSLIGLSVFKKYTPTFLYTKTKEYYEAVLKNGLEAVSKQFYQ